MSDIDPNSSGVIEYVEGLLSDNPWSPPPGEGYNHQLVDNGKYTLIWPFPRSFPFFSSFDKPPPFAAPLFLFGDAQEEYSQTNSMPDLDGPAFVSAFVCGLLYEQHRFDKFGYSDQQEVLDFSKSYLETQCPLFDCGALSDLVQAIILGARPHVGALPATQLLAGAFKLCHPRDPNSSLLWNSWCLDQWLVSEGTDRLDPRIGWVNILQGAPRVISAALPPALNGNDNDWAFIQTHVTYRYCASLLLLGLADKAEHFYRNYGPDLIHHDGFRAKIEKALGDANFDRNELRIIFPSFPDFNCPDAPRRTSTAKRRVN